MTQSWTVAAGAQVAIKAVHVISSAPMRELASRLHPLPATLSEAANLNTATSLLSR